MRTTKAFRSHAEVAEILGCSKQAVQQVEARALAKLRVRLIEEVRREQLRGNVEFDRVLSEHLLNRDRTESREIT